ncbi:ankyrin repeat domain-containing protein [bacterium]|nr:ankyrin repeat domain-containing protein [bacterium]
MKSLTAVLLAIALFPLPLLQAAEERRHPVWRRLLSCFCCDQPDRQVQEEPLPQQTAPEVLQLQRALWTAIREFRDGDEHRISELLAAFPSGQAKLTILNEVIFLSQVLDASLLHIASSEGHTSLVRILIGAGADPAVKDSRGRTPLFVAANNEIAGLLIDNGAPIEAKTIDGYTPLHRAFLCGDASRVRFLVERGAQPSTKIDSFIATSLHCAAYGSTREEVSFLLDYGLGVNELTKTGLNPLHFAAGSRLQDAPVVEELIRQGADINARSKNGFTPLHLAVCRMVRESEGLDAFLSPSDPAT